MIIVAFTWSNSVDNDAASPPHQLSLKVPALKYTATRMMKTTIGTILATVTIRLMVVASLTPRAHHGADAHRRQRRERDLRRSGGRVGMDVGHAAAPSRRAGSSPKSRACPRRYRRRPRRARGAVSRPDA